MTNAQALRLERRRREEMLARRAQTAIGEAIVIMAMLLIAIALMCVAEGGVSDAELEAREVAYWAEQGVTIQRW